MQIKINVREKIARIADEYVFAVCGNSDYTIKFDFDSEWDSHKTKIARFKWEKSYIDVPFSGDECPMPIITNAYMVKIGVSAGNLHTTTPALLLLKRSILDGDETEAEVSQEIKDSLDSLLAGKIDAPQVANVGEVLTVEEVDEEGKPVKWKAAKISGTFVCTFTDADSGNGLICDKTEDEIDAASSKGDNIVGVYDSMVFQLSLIGEYKRFVCQEGRYVYSIYKETTDSNYIMESMFLSDIAPTDVPVAYEVPVSVPTNRGIQWQYGRPLLATDYLVNELTDKEKALMQKNLGIDDLGLVKYTVQKLTDWEQKQARTNVGASFKPISFLNPTDEQLIQAIQNISQQRGTCIVAGWGTDVDITKQLVIYCPYNEFNGTGYKKYNGIAVGDTNGGVYQYTCQISSMDGNYLRFKELSTKLPSPSTAQVGQIVKIKAVDETGKITETETVDMPSQKTLKWITVHSADLAEAKRELIISTDTDGNSIADYNPIGLSLILSTPADSTEESTNGAPWVYPSATISDSAIRVIGTIAGWKTIARNNAFIFSGNSSAMSCTGNVNTSFATYKVDGYALNGVKIFFNNANDHLPVGTHVEVAILCEVEQ